jgi:hypothetical protein
MTTLIVAKSVPNTAPSTILVASIELLQRITTVCERATKVQLTDAMSVEVAKACAKEMRALVKEIEDERKSYTKKLDEITTAAIELQKECQAPVTTAWEALTTRIDAFVREENRKLEEKRAAAEKERQRLQKIEDDKAAAELKRLEAIAAENAIPGDLPEEVPVTAALPVNVPMQYIGKGMTMATKAKIDYSLEFTDASKIPIMSPQQHLLRPVDHAELMKYLKTLPAGKREIAGAVRLIETPARSAK